MTVGTPSTSTAKLDALTGLRFVAALHVVLFHFFGASSWLPRAARNIVGSGYVGVSFFFVLSEFVLSYNYLNSSRGLSISPKAFLAARFARVYPVYVVGLALAAPMFLYRAHSADVDAIHVATRALAAMGLLQAWSPTTATAWNPPGWSLSAEAFFYASFPLIAHLLNRSTKRTSIFIAGYCLSLLVSVAYCILNPDDIADPWFTRHKDTWIDVVRFNPLVRLPEFLMGVIAGQVFLDLRSQRLALSATGLRAVALICPAVLGLALAASDAIPYALLHNGLLAPAFAGVILSLPLRGGRLARALASPPLLVLGDASYALYILHFPVQEAVRKTCERFDVSDTSFFLANALAIIIVIAASVLVHRLVEVPARRILRKMMTDESRV